MDQAVDALEVDERAEVDDVRDRALDHVTGREPVEDRLAHLLALVLEHRAAGEHDVVAAAVQLDHLAAKLLAEELVEILDATDIDERGGQEAAHAEVEDQTALDDLDHGALDRLAALGGALDALPCHLEARALLGEDETPLGVLLRHHERVDLVAELHLVGRVHGPADRQLGDRDHALRLVADVDEHLVLVDAHDGAAHDLPLVDHGDGGVVVGDQRAVFGTDPASLGRIGLGGGLVGHQEGRIIATYRKTAGAGARTTPWPRASRPRHRR